MHITHQTNHALRILMYCAANNQRLCKVPQIAARYAISETHLFKILPIMTRGELIETVRGRNGGIRLARAPEQITVGGVVRLTEERFALAECFEDSDTDCPLVLSCRLHSVWSEALDAFLSTLDRYTIADLIGAGDEVADRLGLVAANG
ncbi:Rrf2 family transcriptional regulator [Bauldia sp.]|uniref:Rrf2 family transcriptional regulator n=1 Tax=Bauldia sp. TaxID=2575872 RepID=UPI003BA9AF05